MSTISTSDGVSESRRLRLDSDEWTEEGRKSQSHCRYWPPTASHPEGRKRTCGNDSGVKEMIPFVVGWEANKRWIGHLRVPIRHENESKSANRGFGPFVPPLPLACRAVRRQKSSNRETFLNKRGEGAGGRRLHPSCRPPPRERARATSLYSSSSQFGALRRFRRLSLEILTFKKSRSRCLVHCGISYICT